MPATWRTEITSEMQKHGDSLIDVVDWAPRVPPLKKWLDQPFDDACGAASGIPFTVWTRNRVYFPASQDGRESCASVSRHPDATPTRHIGAQE